VVRRALFLIPLVVLVAGVAMAANAPLTGNIEAFKVVSLDDGKEQLLPADEANPNDVIEYRLTYANGSPQAIHHVSVTDPVPVGTNYMGLTASAPRGVAVEFSVDYGKTFQAWPVRVKSIDEDGKEVWQEATPDMVTHIRWTLSDALDPETEITFAYRAIIE
jgi:uncharacterized repeat protein (TIGR01451 family)